MSLNCVNEDDLCPIECEIVGRSFLVYDDYLEESEGKFEGRFLNPEDKFRYSSPNHQ